MSREIKFRTWDKKYNLMDYESFWIDSTGTVFEQANRTYDTPNTEIETVDHLIVMQYTGLKDKNGVDIYEGDIVKAHYHYFDGNFDADGEIIGEIIYSEWCTYGIGNSSLPDNGGWMEIYETSHLEEPCLEVIGNKLEHPELLEG